MLRRSKRFEPPLSFRKLRGQVNGIISLGHQTGEGWLLTAEMMELLNSGVPNILCMQPFGCLPNHITGKACSRSSSAATPTPTSRPWTMIPAPVKSTRSTASSS